MLTVARSSTIHTEQGVAFQEQQRLRERPTMLRYTYIAYLVLYACHSAKIIWIQTWHLYELRKAGREAVLICTAAETWLQDKLIPQPCVEYLSQCWNLWRSHLERGYLAKKKKFICCITVIKVGIYSHWISPTALFWSIFNLTLVCQCSLTIINSVSFMFV